MSERLIVLSAGGTGGHLFPAESLAAALKPHGARIVLMTDSRVGGISGTFPADEIVQVSSATPSGGSLVGTACAGLKLGWGTLGAMRPLRRLKPDAVVGFGGYPTVPPLIAASIVGIPTIVHEQNGVMGRANRLLARRASLIATGFPGVRSIPVGISANVVHTGNPVRPAVIEAAKTTFSVLNPSDIFRLLVFGGSQGARVMSDIVPAGLALLPEGLRSRLSLTQQARAEDADRVCKLYAELGIQADIQPFFSDLPQRMADAHFVIARSGASTVAELAVLGRPSLLVPLPGALDQDQVANARYLSDAGGAEVVLQENFTPERLAFEITKRFDDPSILGDAAYAAKKVGIADAGKRLADAILSYLSSRP